MSLTIPLPDLRLEQTFIKSLHNYAKTEPLSKKDLKQKNEFELDALNDELDLQEQEEISNPLPITPSIVIYAVVKDHILMPLIQGFAFAGLLILTKPLLLSVIRHGQRTGHRLNQYLATILGLKREFGVST